MILNPSLTQPFPVPTALQNTAIAPDWMRAGLEGYNPPAIPSYNEGVDVAPEWMRAGLEGYNPPAMPPYTEGVDVAPEWMGQRPITMERVIPEPYSGQEIWVNPTRYDLGKQQKLAAENYSQDMGLPLSDVIHSELLRYLIDREGDLYTADATNIIHRMIADASGKTVTGENVLFEKDKWPGYGYVSPGNIGSIPSAEIARAQERYQRLNPENLLQLQDKIRNKYGNDWMLGAGLSPRDIFLPQSILPETGKGGNVVRSIPQWLQEAYANDTTLKTKGFPIVETDLRNQNVRDAIAMDPSLTPEQKAMLLGPQTGLLSDSLGKGGNVLKYMPHPDYTGQSGWPEKPTGYGGLRPLGGVQVWPDAGDGQIGWAGTQDPGAIALQHQFPGAGNAIGANPSTYPLADMAVNKMKQDQVAKEDNINDLDNIAAEIADKLWKTGAFKDQDALIMEITKLPEEKVRELYKKLFPNQGAQ